MVSDFITHFCNLQDKDTFPLPIQEEQPKMFIEFIVPVHQAFLVLTARLPIWANPQK